MGIFQTATDDPRADAALLVEAAQWLDEEAFERSYWLAMGATQPRYTRTVTSCLADPLQRWKHPTFRAPHRDAAEPALQRAMEAVA